MADKTRIEWTDATWNPVTGCTKVSDGCKHCYAERDWTRLSALRAVPNRYTGRQFTDVREHYDIIDQPLLWKRPRRIFVNSMSDLFHESVSDRFIADVFGVMAAAHWHTFQVLTKRPERMHELLNSGSLGRFESDADECAAIYTDRHIKWPLQNVWLGVSVEDQATADERIPFLVYTRTAVRWVSCEPLLGPVDLMAINGKSHGFDVFIDWVVVGGESGAKARPMHPNWVRGIRDQCAATDTPFMFKQWGEWAPHAPVPGGDEGGDLRKGRVRYLQGTPREPDGRFIRGDAAVARVGKQAAGRLLDGVLHDAYPE